MTDKKNCQDNIFSEPYEKIKAFAFDEKVVNVFPDMIKRSVPGYDTILKGIAMMAQRYCQPGTNVYDLGASLGAVSMTIDQTVGNMDLSIFAIDNSAAMIEGLQDKLKTIELNNKLLPMSQDILETEINNSSMVVSNFTLQFMPKETRRNTCKKVYDGLVDYGLFVLSEKIESSENLIDFYHGYKKINGYSDMEVAQKRQALEDSLKPDKLVKWVARLEDSGFKQIEVWFRAFNFVSLVAFK